MNPSDPYPKLPTWLFVATDLACIATAFLIAQTQHWRPSHGWMLAIVGCVAFGAIVGLVPFVARHERQKNEALDERQRALEALSRTVAASAEQISIAAGGLHEIAELAQKNLRTAEHLPHKLQEKIAELQAQLAQAADADKEELERELLALRTSESERLDAVSQRIAKSSAEWAKLETATQQHLAAATEALGKLQLGTANAIGKAQAAAEQALGLARTEAARSLGEASGQATRAIESAKSAALAELEAKLAAVTAAATQLADKLAATQRTLDDKLARAAAEPTPANASAPALDLPPPPPTPASVPATPLDVASPSVSEPAAASPASPPKRPRKSRRDEPATESVAAAPAPTTAPAPAPADEPPPVPAQAIPEIVPAAPHTAEPFSGKFETVPPSPAPADEQTPAPAAADSSARPPEPEAAAPEEPKPPRKRAAKKPEPAPELEEPSLGLELEEPSSRAAAAGVLERVLSSDGATRLFVTAYIGIGNRLFIRGDGPGLSWEKGVPLQFVSIGKWRWETNDAAAPVQFKLYKNDDLECASLGRQTLEPGHQQEVTAAF